MSESPRPYGHLLGVPDSMAGEPERYRTHAPSQGAAPSRLLPGKPTPFAAPTNALAYARRRLGHSAVISVLVAMREHGYTADHDRQNSPLDWFHLLDRQITHLLEHAESGGDGQDDDTDRRMAWDKCLTDLVMIGALVQAAIEAQP